MKQKSRKTKKETKTVTGAKKGKKQESNDDKNTS